MVLMVVLALWTKFRKWVFFQKMEGQDVPNFPLTNVMTETYTDYAAWCASTCKERNITIVEVGSGDGRAAKWFLDRGCDVICVDPAPASYYNDNHEIVTQPKFADVNEVPESLIGKCALMLIRPTPCDAYDINALNRLKPRIVFAVYQADGADGSPGLHRWLHDNDSVSCHSFDLGELSDESGCELEMQHSASAFFPERLETRQKISIKTCTLLTRDIELPDELDTGDQSDGLMLLSDIQRLYQESLCVIC